jgi:hypothetical protein
MTNLVSFAEFIDKYNLNSDLKNFPKLYTINPSSPFNKKWNIEYIITHADTVHEQNENNNAIIRGEKRKKERMLSELIPIKNEDLVSDISFPATGSGIMELLLYILDNRYLTLEDYQKKEYLKTFIAYISQINNSQKNQIFKDYFENKLKEGLNKYQCFVFLHIMGIYLEVNFKVENIVIKGGNKAWISLEFNNNGNIKPLTNSVVDNLDIDKCKDFYLITKKSTMVDIISICNEFGLPIKNGETKLKKEVIIANIYGKGI